MDKKAMALCAAILCAACLFTACKERQAPQTGYTALEIASAVWDSQPDSAAPHILTWGDDAFTTYLEAYYGIGTDTLADGAVLYAGGTSASEVVVFELTAPSEADAVGDSLQRYTETRIGDFYGYMPDQVFKLEQSVVVQNGSFMALLVCVDPDRASAAFTDCFREGGLTERAVTITTADTPSADTSPETQDTSPYDPDAILAAWKSGDLAGLSDKNRAILEACASVIDKVTTAEMSDYEKELAIHDWIIDWTDYDDEEISHTGGLPHPDNQNPYGALIARRAICTGYTSTFQLFMDLLEIECITVEGTVYEEENEHAWNMVRLDDGEWYCVDITWDDPMDMTEYEENFPHAYFNVTSDYLREYDHQWDYAAVPEATSSKYQSKA